MWNRQHNEKTAIETPMWKNLQHEKDWLSQSRPGLHSVWAQFSPPTVRGSTAASPLMSRKCVQNIYRGKHLTAWSVVVTELYAHVKLVKMSNPLRSVLRMYNNSMSAGVGKFHRKRSKLQFTFESCPLKSLSLCPLKSRLCRLAVVHAWSGLLGSFFVF